MHTTHNTENEFVLGVKEDCNESKKSHMKRSNARVGNFCARHRTKSENGILDRDSCCSKDFENEHLKECMIIAEREAVKHHVKMRRAREENRKDEIVTAIFNYSPKQNDELELRRGDKVRVLSQNYKDSGTEGWWVGQRDSQIGVFPGNFVDTDCDWSLKKGSEKSQPIVTPRTPNENRSFKLISESKQSNQKPDDVPIFFSSSRNDFPAQLSRSSTGFAISGSTGVRTIPAEEIEKLEELGFGSFGMVSRGRWKYQDVALKTFSWQANEMHIYQEAGHLSCLVHRNIVRLFGVSLLQPIKDSKPQLALIMEYARGGALHRLLHADGYCDIHLSPRTLLEMSRQIAAGMRYLHCEAHICHRDLKSSNVLIKEAISINATDFDISRCTLLITDFGMARRTSELVSQQSKLGTLAYAAPEVCKQQGRFTVKSDVWSYGVLLWEMLIKEIPYRNVEHPHLLYKIAFTNHKLYIPQGIPPILVKLLRKCWAEDKNKRPDFGRILEILNETATYEFIDKLADEFHELQKEWQEEIRNIENLENVECASDDLEESIDSFERKKEKLLQKQQQKLEEARYDLERREVEMQQREEACDRAMGTMVMITVLAANQLGGGNTATASSGSTAGTAAVGVPAANMGSDHSVINNISSTSGTEIPQRRRHQSPPSSLLPPPVPPRKRPFVNLFKFWSIGNGQGSSHQQDSVGSPATECSSSSHLFGGNPNISHPSNLQHVVHISKDGLNFASPALNFFPDSMKMHTWDPKTSQSRIGFLQFRDRLQSTNEEETYNTGSNIRGRGGGYESNLPEDLSLRTTTTEDAESPSPCLETPGSGSICGSGPRSGRLLQNQHYYYYRTNDSSAIPAKDISAGNGKVGDSQSAASTAVSSLCASAPNLRKESLGNLPVVGFSSFRRPLYCDTDLDTNYSGTRISPYSKDDPPAIYNCPSCYFKWLDHRKIVPCDRCACRPDKKSETNKYKDKLIPQSSVDLPDKCQSQKNSFSNFNKRRNCCCPAHQLKSSSPPWDCMPAYPPRFSKNTRSRKHSSSSNAHLINTNISQNKVSRNRYHGSKKQKIQQHNSSSKSKLSNARNLDNALWSVMRMLSAVVLPDRTNSSSETDDCYKSKEQIEDPSSSVSQSLDTSCIQNSNENVLFNDLSCASIVTSSGTFVEPVFYLAHNDGSRSPPIIPANLKQNSIKSSISKGRSGSVGSAYLNINSNVTGKPPTPLSQSNDSHNINSGPLYRGSSVPPKTSRKQHSQNVRENSWISRLRRSGRPSQQKPHQRITPDAISSPIPINKTAHMGAAVDPTSITVATAAAAANFFASWQPHVVGSVSSDLKQTSHGSRSFDSNSSYSCDQRA